MSLENHTSSHTVLIELLWKLKSIVKIRFQRAIRAVSAAQRCHLGLVCMAEEAFRGLGARQWARTLIEAFVTSLGAMKKLIIC